MKAFDLSVSGSLTVTGSVTGSAASTASFGRVEATVVDPKGLPTGTMSGSVQTKANLPTGVISGSEVSESLPPGTVSGSAQIAANLPAGVISGSGNLSASLPPGTMSGSAQTAINLPRGVVSSSAQLMSGSVGVMSGSAQTKANLPTGVISASMSISGSISASAISTASFGQLRIGGTDGTTSFAVISGSGASGVVRISGSSVSTGSFGRLETLQTNASFGGNVITVEAATNVNQDLTTDATPTFAGLTSTGTITAQEIHTVFISASIAKATGSTTFGDDSADIHQFTGSLQIGSVVGEKTTIASASVSGSATSTGSFGKVEATTITGIIPSVLSGSAQVTANLPTGVISGSGNLSASLPPGTVSASAQLSADISGSSGNKATPGFAIAMSVAL